MQVQTLTIASSSCGLFTALCSVPCVCSELYLFVPCTFGEYLYVFPICLSLHFFNVVVVVVVVVVVIATVVVVLVFPVGTSTTPVR